MNNIALFVKDFQKGTELSDRLATVNINITFAESIYDLPDQCQIGLIDLDDEKKVEVLLEGLSPTVDQVANVIDRIKRKNVDLDKEIIMWDVLSADFDTNISKEKCLQNVLKNTQNGSIIVFHDSEKAFKNLEYVLPKVLAYFSEKGFVFSGLTGY